MILDIKNNLNNIIKYTNLHNHKTGYMIIIQEEGRKEIKSEIKNSKALFCINLAKLIKNMSVYNGLKASTHEKYLYYKTLKEEDFVAYEIVEILFFSFLGKIELELRYIIFNDKTFGISYIWETFYY